MDDKTKQVDSVTGTTTTGQMKTASANCERAIAALVAVGVLRQHRLVVRLLDRLSACRSSPGSPAAHSAGISRAAAIRTTLPNCGRSAAR